MGAQVTLNPLPAQVYGQPDHPRSVNELAAPLYLAPNLAEGRELFGPQSVALDTSVDPPIVYVADTGNHRVLAWRDAAGFANGARADLVIGQRDFSSTAAIDITKSPSSGSSLYAPASLAVDSQGNLFVVDAGNNRILRFPKPFEQPQGGMPAADLVIGQPDLNSRDPSQSKTAGAAPTAATIRTNAASTGGIQNAGLAFDAEGNLWFCDSGNHRLLRYPASAVSGGSNTGAGGAVISADMVLGQPDFNSATPNPGRVSQPADRMRKDSFRFGGPLAFDASGNLFFADDLARVLVWKPPLASGKPADRILGIYLLKPGEPPPPAVNQWTFGANLGGTASNLIFAGGPQGLFSVGGYLFVVDTYNNRVVRFDPVSTWPDEDPANGVLSPAMAAVFGQPDFNARQANLYPFIEPSAGAFDKPVAGAYAAGQVFVVDSGNHRVMGHPYDAESNNLLPATHLLGQYDFPFRTPNLIEGREISSGTVPIITANQILTLTLGPAAAVDRPANPDEPPHLYLADTGNHRILGYYDARKFKFGDTADLVIGQVDLYRSIINSPTNDPASPVAGGLLLPASLAVDALGNLWVADTGNGRVIRFPRPFDHWGEQQTADLVLGQPDLSTRPDGQPSRSRLYRPSGIAFTGDGRLVVADMAHHRVVVFNPPFSDGQEAALVLGQPDGQTATAGSLINQMNLPLSVSTDAQNRIYVADTNNNRLLVFDRPEFLADGANAGLLLPFSSQNVTPAAVTVESATGNVWVADIKGSRVLRYPAYEALALGGSTQANYSFSTYGPRNITFDAAGNLMVLDSANRITMHYPALSVVNGASGFPRAAPAMVAQLEAPGVSFAAEAAEAGPAPLPTQMAGLEVSVNGTPAPLSRVSGGVIRFLIPKDAPTAGYAEFLVRSVATGGILAHNWILMWPASPAVLYQNGNPGAQGQARALNQDGAVNSSSSPAASNQEMTVFLTGYGPIDGLPEDGAAPGAEIPVPGVDAFLVTAQGAIPANLISSVTDANEPGVWRVRVKLPQVAADANYVFAVIYRSMASNNMMSGTTRLTVAPVVSVKK